MSFTESLFEKEIQEISPEVLKEDFGGQVLLLYRINSGKGALFVPYEAIEGTVLSISLAVVESRELAGLEELPNVIHAELEGKRAPHLYVIALSNLTKKEAFDFADLIFGNPSSENISRNRLWVLRKISSSNDYWTGEAVRPIIEKALYEQKFNKPVGKRRIGFYSGEYNEQQPRRQQEEKEPEDFVEFLRKKSVVDIYPVYPRLRAEDLESLQLVFQYLVPKWKGELFKRIIGSASYAFLIHDPEQYLTREVFNKIAHGTKAKLYLSALKYLIQEEHRFVADYVKERASEKGEEEEEKESKGRSERKLEKKSEQGLGEEGLEEEFEKTLRIPKRPTSSKFSRSRREEKKERKLLPEEEEENEIEEQLRRRAIYTKDFIFSADELEFVNLATIRSSNEAKRMLQYYVGSYLDDLDLRDSAITGSAMTAALFTPWGYNRRDGKVTNFPLPQDKKRVEEDWIDVIYPAYYTDPDGVPQIPYTEASLRDSKYAVEGDFLIQERNGLVNRYTFTEGSDVDIAVFDHKNFETIARGHMVQIKKHYPSLVVKVIERKKGLMFQLTDPKYRIRPVQIYPASIEQILTHHSPSVRAWYQGRFYLAATAVRAFIDKEINEHYYFTGKSPYKIIYRQVARGFYVRIYHAERYLDNYVEQKIPGADWRVSRFRYYAEENMPLRMDYRLFLEIGVDLRTINKQTYLESKFRPVFNPERAGIGGAPPVFGGVPVFPGLPGGPVPHFPALAIPGVHHLPLPAPGLPIPAGALPEEEEPEVEEAGEEEPEVEEAGEAEPEE